MGFRFRQSVRLFPGFRLNFSKRGTSLSIGWRGLRTNVSARGVRNTVSLPGTGLSYSSFTPTAKKQGGTAMQPPVLTQRAPANLTRKRRVITVVGVLATIALIYVLFAQ